MSLRPFAVLLLAACVEAPLASGNLGPTVSLSDDVPGPSSEVQVDPDTTPAVDSAAPLADLPYRPNVVLVVLDDWGVDMWAPAGATSAPPTPTIDHLAAEGVSFARAWSAPNCSPSRAALMSGLPPRLSGIGDVLGCPNGDGLPFTVETVAERMSDAGYATAMYGKWHLGRIQGELDPLEAADPRLQGFDDYAGAVLPSDHCSTDGLGHDHYDWERCDNGVCARITEYDTASQFDDATAATTSLPEPWFVYLPVYAPHAPYVDPPDPIAAGGATGPQRRYRSMVADVDARLATLLSGVDFSDTFVVVVGDNGSPGAAVMSPAAPERSKGTAYDGGVHVPLIVRGPGIVEGGEARQLVHLTDLFATLSDLAGNPIPADHPAAGTSQSLVGALRDPEGAPGRDVLSTEGFEGVGTPARRPERTMQAIVDDEGWKLIRIDTCVGEADPDNDHGWICDQPKTWADPIVELYGPGDGVPGVDGVDVLADGVTAREQVRRARLLARLDADFAPQTLP